MVKGFNFKSSWFDALKDMPNNVRRQVYDAIIQYCCTGTVAELKSVAKGAFAVIKYDIDSVDKAEAEKQQSLSEKRSEAAKKSVAARKQKAMAAEKTAELANLPVKDENKAKEAEKVNEPEEVVDEKEASNVVEAEEANEVIVEKEANNVVEAKEAVDEAKSASARCAEFAKKYHLSGDYVREINNIINKNNNINQEKETHKKELSSAEDEERKQKAQEIVDYWNETNKQNASLLDACSTLTKSRIRKVCAAVKNYGVDQVREAISDVFKSKFLTGEGPNGWRASFDWLFRGENLLKVVEGNYTVNVNVKSNQKYKIDPRRGTEAVECEPWEYF